ncbi:Hypothetical protein PHPALM_19704 [Phytophthora palmivora]|uniref:Retrotransposon gag domain-containing protein n=1 Tax=Phytophthora palmivora TaxID=4796 RepID=A0A2P4XGR3_9STRA|nr:Hypothetical protein PHPALM_19704 [Phytophthora palmivora]
MFSLQQQAMATSQEQMRAFMQQQARFQREMYEKHARANPPKFHGCADEDMELWLFHIEEHFATPKMDWSSDDSRFLDIVVPFLDVDAMAWHREFKHSTGNNPETWSVFKHQIRSPYRDNDYDIKFMQLLSISSIDMPETVKRWFYQHNLRADHNPYVSQYGPLTLKDTIDHAQQFEDSREAPTSMSSSIFVSTGKTTMIIATRKEKERLMKGKRRMESP